MWNIDVSIPFPVALKSPAQEPPRSPAQESPGLQSVEFTFWNMNQDREWRWRLEKNRINYHLLFTDEMEAQTKGQGTCSNHSDNNQQGQDRTWESQPRPGALDIMF